MDSMESKKSPVFELAAASVHRTLVFRRLRIPTTIKKQAPKWVPAFLEEDEGFEFAEESPLVAKRPHLVSLSSDLFSKCTVCTIWHVV